MAIKGPLCIRRPRNVSTKIIWKDISGQRVHIYSRPENGFHLSVRFPGKLKYSIYVRHGAGPPKLRFESCSFPTIRSPSLTSIHRQPPRPSCRCFACKLKRTGGREKKGELDLSVTFLIGISVRIFRFASISDAKMYGGQFAKDELNISKVHFLHPIFVHSAIWRKSSCHPNHESLVNGSTCPHLRDICKPPSNVHCKRHRDEASLYFPTSAFPRTLGP